MHRIDDVESLPSRRFFMLAERLEAYQGAMRYRLEREQEEAQAEMPRSLTSQQGTSVKHFQDIKHNPELAEYFD